MVQEKYWKELYQLKVHVKYIELYHENAVDWERGFNILLAITSSGSIAGWLVWEKASILWAIIIGASQIVSVIKEFLPFKVRVASLPALNHKLDQLANSSEKNWAKVESGELTEKEINNLWHEMKSKKTEYVHQLLAGGTLPEKHKLLKAAEKSTEVYFNHFYSS